VNSKAYRSQQRHGLTRNIKTKAKIKQNKELNTGENKSAKNSRRIREIGLMGEEVYNGKNL